MLRNILLLLAVAQIGAVQAIPPPPQSQPATIHLPDNNCPLTVGGTARPYDPATFEFEGTAANVLLLALDEPRPELVFELTDETHDHALVVSGAGFGEGDVRITLSATARYALSVHVRGDYARRGTSTDFKLKLFLRQSADAAACRVAETAED